MNELDENEINQTDTTGNGNEEVLVAEGDDFGNGFTNASLYSDATNNFALGILGAIEQPGDIDKFKLSTYVKLI